MTDRIKGYVVVLDIDYRDDDAEEIRKALSMVKGVLSVSPVVADVGDAIAQQRVRYTLLEKLSAMVREGL